MQSFQTGGVAVIHVALLATPVAVGLDLPKTKGREALS
jgi:hypothetical protein